VIVVQVVYVHVVHLPRLHIDMLGNGTQLIEVGVGLWFCSVRFLNFGLLFGKNSCH